MSQRYDVIVIGAGIIGLATALKLLKREPGRKIAVLEKEADIARHQTGHNSGVIHSGVYYKSGSVKATTCADGRLQLLKFCDDHGIKYELCGKVIVATDSAELPRLEELYKRGVANGVPGLRLIGPQELKEIEPHAAGIKALYSPEAGIVDFTEVAKAIVQEIVAAGGEILTNQRVVRIIEKHDELVVGTASGEFRTSRVINCAGLFSDELSGLRDIKIIPFRGEYYRLAPQSQHLVKALIYPVPDPRFPFLGVHFTRNMHGYVEAGPNAVLAFAKEGYRKSDINLGQLAAIFGFKGFRLVAQKYWRTGVDEMRRSFSKRLFTKALQRLIPQVQEEDLVAGGSGVRAQAVQADGTLLDDFAIEKRGRVTHVINAPSPGATACFAIADHILTLVDPF